MLSDCYSLAPVPKADITVVSGLLGIFLWCYSVHRMQESWSCPAPSLAPTCTLREGTLPWDHRFSHSLSSALLCTLWGSAPIKWCPQGTAFALSSVLCWGFLHGAKFSHIWDSLFTSCIYWNHCKSVHCSQWAVSSERQQQSCEDELCGEVPTSAFRYRISINVSPGAILHSDDNFRPSTLTRNLNLYKTMPLVSNAESFLGAVSALLSLYPAAPQTPMSLSQSHREQQ